MDDLYKKALGDVDISSMGDWSPLTTLTDHDLTAARDQLRGELVAMARRHVKQSWLRRGADEAELGWTEQILEIGRASCRERVAVGDGGGPVNRSEVK